MRAVKGEIVGPPLRAATTLSPESPFRPHRSLWGPLLLRDCGGRYSLLSEFFQPKLSVSERRRRPLAPENLSFRRLLRGEKKEKTSFFENIFSTTPRLGPCNNYDEKRAFVTPNNARRPRLLKTPWYYIRHIPAASHSQPCIHYDNTHPRIKRRYTILWILYDTMMCVTYGTKIIRI